MAKKKEKSWQIHGWQMHYLLFMIAFNTPYMCLTALFTEQGVITDPAAGTKVQVRFKDCAEDELIARSCLRPAPPVNEIRVSNAKKERYVHVLRACMFMLYMHIVYTMFCNTTLFCNEKRKVPCKHIWKRLGIPGVPENQRT